MKRITWPREPVLDHLPERTAVLERLASEAPDVLKPVLRQLCPCRNLTYDREIWNRIVQIGRSSTDWYVRETANHALGTLQERARFDSRAVDLLLWLADQGAGETIHPRWLRRQRETRAPEIRQPKVALRDVPVLLEALASEDPADVANALRAVCPGHGRRYPARAWAAIFGAQRAPDALTRARAGKAVTRLLDHAAGDPDAREMLRRFAPESAEEALAPAEGMPAAPEGCSPGRS